MSKNITYRLDDKVIIAMFAVSFFFLGLMSFRYKIKEPCTTVDFSYRTANKFDVAYTSESVYFSAEIKYNVSGWEWDFGDKTTNDTKSGPYATHQYKEPGQYTVRLTINNKCEQIKTINVNRRGDNKKKLYLLPLWPDETLTAGKQYDFNDNTEGAVTWSWYFDQEPKILQKHLTHMFTEPGTHKVILVINDDIENNRVEKSFTVEPPETVTTTLPKRRGKNARADNIPQDIPTDKIAGPSLDDLAKPPKLPTVSDDVLKGYLLNINAGGYNELLKYFRKNNFDNCIILHNNRTVTVAKLKELINMQRQYNKTFEVKQALSSDNNIIQIAITATLEPKKRLLLKDKPREYNYN